MLDKYGDAWSPAYLYVRTRLEIRNDQDSLFDVLLGIPHSYQVLIGVGGPPWLDGVVVRMALRGGLADFVHELQLSLSELATWALHDGQSSFEPHGGALVRMFYENTSEDEGLCHQVLVRYKDWERDPDQVSEHVKSALGQEARSVFHFRNGRIFLVRSAQPSSLLIRRLEKVQKNLHSAAVIDGDGRMMDLLGRGGFTWGEIPDEDV